MKNNWNYGFLFLIILMAVIFAGCSVLESPTLEPEVTAPPVATSAEEVETEPSSQEGETSSALGNTVTELDQIVGTWIAPAYPGNFVLTVFPDGKLSVATSLADLERGSTDSWDLNIEDGQITATNFALCLGDIGTYIAEINEVGNLRFISLIDPCDARVRKMDRSLPGRLNPYILIYRPVLEY